MLTRTVLSSHPISYLKQEIAKQNITGYSKLKKPALIELMLKHKHKFPHIKHNFTTKQKIKKEPKGAPTHTMPNGVEHTGAKHTSKSKPTQKRITPKPLQPVPKASTPKPKKKKRIAPTIISNAPKGSPLKGKGYGTAYDKTLARLEKNAKTMDESKKGKKLISNAPIKKSKEPKTKGDYRTGRNYATVRDYM